MRGHRIRTGLAGAVMVAVLMTGCTAARSSLGTSNGSCYLALGTATKAVGPHAHLVGVQLFTLKDLRTKAPRLFGAISQGQSISESVCVSAFTGTFTSNHVSKPLGRPSGKLAVVVTTPSGSTLLGTVIFRRAPLHFGHSHLL